MFWKNLPLKSRRKIGRGKTNVTLKMLFSESLLRRFFRFYFLFSQIHFSGKILFSQYQSFFYFLKISSFVFLFLHGNRGFLSRINVLCVFESSYLLKIEVNGVKMVFKMVLLSFLFLTLRQSVSNWFRIGFFRFF